MMNDEPLEEIKRGEHRVPAMDNRALAGICFQLSIGVDSYGRPVEL
jgi:hypothetical protein